MEILDQLESRIAQLLDTLSLMQMEIEELTEKNQTLQNQSAQESAKTQSLEEEVNTLRAEQQKWQNRLRALLGKIDEVSAENESHSAIPATTDVTTDVTIHTTNTTTSSSHEPNLGGEQQTLL